MNPEAQPQAEYLNAHPSVSGFVEFASRPHFPTFISPQVLTTNFMDPDIELQRRINKEIDKGFNESANPLWSLYGKMAKEDDKATLEDITSGMEGLLLFVRFLFSTLPLL